MRGAFHAVCFVLVMSGCSIPPAPNPVTEIKPADPPPRGDVPPPLVSEGTAYRFPQPEKAPEERPGIKGTGAVPVRLDTTPKREPHADEVVKLQKEIVARNPADDDEALRLALLYASAGQFEDAKASLKGLRSRNHKLVPLLDYHLDHMLGEHKEAKEILEAINEEERRITGFVIGKAELCSRIRRYREFVPAETDRVKPGGVVLLYVEPRNFTLKRNQDKYIVHLKYEWKLLDDRSVEHLVQAWDKAPLSDREDRNIYNGPVNEFYQSFALPLPQNLAMGHYRVKVTVTDAHTDRSDRVYVPIYVTEK